MKTKLSLAVTLALISAGMISGCSDDNEPTASQQEAPQSNLAPMLQYIPADSPYFMATRESMPEQEAFDLYRRMQPQGSLETDLDELRRTLPEIDDEVQRSLLALVIAIGEEVDSVETLDDAHALGLKMGPQAAFYGLGILPVWRMQLHDEEAFRETLQRILTKAEITPITATTNGNDYWELTQAGPLRAILAIIDQQVLISVVPPEASDELLAQVLGNSLPESSIGDTGALAEIEQRHGFTPYGAGQIDSSRLLNELSAPTHSASQALMDAVELAPLGLSSCQADIDRITGRFPGLAMGTREYSLEGMEMNLILETDEEIVSDLRALTTQVPGLGSTEGMASFGLGLDLPVLTQTIQKYAREVREHPFSCDELQDLNRSWNEINLAVNNPLTLMIGPSLSGFNARIDSLVMKDGDPVATGILALASQNPLSLVSTASAFLPELGALGLEPGGETKKINSMLLPPDMPALYAAMSDTAIVLGAGINDAATLKDALDAPASEPDLLLHGHMTGEFYDSLADVMAQIPAEDMSEADIELFKQYGDIYQNMAYWLEVDDAGVEMGFSLELK